MFGYVRPRRCYLRVCEWEYFRAAYCGLCHELARRYGFFSRFLLGYDFTTLALALSAYGGAEPACPRRCPASPFRKRNCLSGEAFSLTADLSMILFTERLRDSVADNSFFRGLPARLGLVFFSVAMRRAARLRTETYGIVKKELAHLHSIEQMRPGTIDPPADSFATLLSHLARDIHDVDGRRVLGQFFYHLGRWIYLMDACDDMADDAKNGSYNPVAARFGLEGGRWSDEAEAAVRETVSLSRREMESALSLLPETAQARILENIVAWGMPPVEEQVLAGVFKKRGKMHERPI